MSDQSSAWSIYPSQFWEGSDGPWSTFAIRVGTPPVLVRILPATSQSSIWTVLPEGCTSFPNFPQDCPTLRGVTFNPNQSSSFIDGTSGTLVKLPFQSEADISSNATSSTIYEGGAILGYDIVGLGTNGDNTPTLTNQTLACFAAQNPFLGQLGLRPENNTPNAFTDQHDSVLGSLNTSGHIASLSYGYTAGSKARNAFGSLTIGGYDAARATVEDVLKCNMSIPARKDMQLVVSNLKIGSTTVDNWPTAATYFIDSMVPELWLPENVCDQLESAYGLTYDADYQMYFLDNAQHDNLTTYNALATSLSFSLQALGDNSRTIEINIPYMDLDHQVKYPQAGIADDSTFYYHFPIRRANGSSQYYLGRTFLQAAYLGVDFDKGTFNISQAVFPTPNTNKNIVQIVNHRTASSSPGGLSAGAIAGIAIGAAAAVAFIVGLIFFYLRKKRRDRSRFSTATTFRSPSMDGTTIHEGKPETSQPYDPSMVGYEHYNKGPLEMNGEEQDQFKPELQGSFAHTREVSELYGSSVRRRSDQSRASISPLPREESQRGRMRHLRHYSDSSFGSPSPAGVASPRSGMESPPSVGYPSPPLEMEGGSFAGPFELHGRSQTASPVPGVESGEAGPVGGEVASSAPAAGASGAVVPGGTEIESSRRMGEERVIS